MKGNGFSEAAGAVYLTDKKTHWSIEDQKSMLAHLLRPQLGTSRARTVANTLVREFGSLPASLSAPAHRLREVAGLGSRTIEHLALSLEIVRCFTQEHIDHSKPLLASWSQLLDYLRSHMAFETVEQFRILFLDRKNRLIADEVQQIGTVDHVPIYPREVIKRSLQFSATALILVHNHPSGDPTPSSADIRMTGEIADAAKPLGITVLDHIIIGKIGHTSLRACKLI